MATGDPTDEQAGRTVEVELLDDEDDGAVVLEADERGRIRLPDDLPVRTLPSYNLPAVSEHVGAGDPLTTYLAQLRHITPLSAEEQQQLAEAYHEHGDMDAARDLIMSNLRLVVKIAREYHRRRTSLMELVQEGNVGLAEAIRRYDPYRGVRFTSYAQYWIRAMILNYLMNVMQLVKVGSTRSGRKLFYNLRKAREELIQQGYLTPTTRQLADHLGVTESEVIDVAQILDQPAMSLEAPAPGTEATPLSTIIADDNADTPHDLAEELDVRQRIRGAVDAFRARLVDERDIAIWDERIAADDEALSLQELGDRFGVSRERIRQLEKVLKDRFRAFWIDEVGASESAIIIADD